MLYHFKTKQKLHKNKRTLFTVHSNKQLVISKFFPFLLEVVSDFYFYFSMLYSFLVLIPYQFLFLTVPKVIYQPKYLSWPHQCKQLLIGILYLDILKMHQNQYARNRTHYLSTKIHSSCTCCWQWHLPNYLNHLRLRILSKLSPPSNCSPRFKLLIFVYISPIHLFILIILAWTI